MKTPPIVPTVRVNAQRREAGKRIALMLGAAPFLAIFPACGGGEETSSGSGTPGTANTPSYWAPSEEAAHVATYMAFASEADGIWTEPSTDHAGLNRVRADLVDVAKAIGTYEPVKMLVLSTAEQSVAQALLDKASAANPAIHAQYVGRAAGVGGVELIVSAAGFNDYWTRDTAPVFVKDTANGNALTAVSFNFNGWGNANSASMDEDVPTASNQTKKAEFFQPYANDQKVASTVAARHGATVVRSTLTLEGGALEWDGEGTAILTESAVLHVNRNPQLFNLTQSGRQVTAATLKSDAKATVEAELKRLLGITKVIWLQGTQTFPAVAVNAETDITNGHVDFYAKFVKPGVVAYAFDESDSTGELAITTAHKNALTGQTDAKGRALTLVPLKTPTTYGSALSVSQKANFAAGYLNYYACNGALVLPKFGDPVADQAAVDALTPHKGDRVVVQVNILGISSGGGGLHCATMQVPA